MSRYPKNYPKEFKCHLCGNCCRGDGFVDMKPDDLDAAAAYFEITREQFIERYCIVQWSGEVYLKDQDDELQSCIFLRDDNTCEIHDAKPQQCKDFPFKWRPRDVMDFCEGMRAAAGLPPNGDRQTMSDKKRR